MAVQYIMCPLGLFALYHTHEHVKYQNLVPKTQGKKKEGREREVRYSTFIITVFWHKHEHRLANFWWQHLNILF